MKKVRVGIIGIGSLSDSHIKAFQQNQGVEVIAVCARSKASCVAKAEKYGIERIYDNSDALLADKDIDAVSILTWTDSHMPISVAALNAGKHVLCEKPPALNADEARIMQKAAADSGKLLMIGFVKRFTERVALAKEIITSGGIGDPYYIKTEYMRRAGNPGGWFADKKRAGGGPLIDIGVHLIDQGLWLFGDAKPVSVFGQVNYSIGARKGLKGLTFGGMTSGSGYQSADSSIRENAEPVEDHACALIRFDNGAVMNVDTSWTMHVQSDRLKMEVFGNSGGLLVDPHIEYFGEFHDYMQNSTITMSEDRDYSGAFFAEISHFIDCIANGVPCISTIDDGVKVMEVIDAIYQSAVTGDKIVL